MTENLEKIINELPPELQQEVLDFVQFLIEKRSGRTQHKPSFNWAGALKDLKNQYSSVELQHKISEWRIGER